MVAQWQAKQHQAAVLLLEAGRILDGAEGGSEDAQREAMERARTLREESDRLSTESKSEHTAARIAAGLPPVQPPAPAPGGGAEPLHVERSSQARPLRYAELFGPPRSLAEEGFDSARDYWTALRSGRFDARLLSTDTHLRASEIATTGVGSQGGFSVPEELVAEMLNASLEDEIVRPRARVTPMASASKEIWGFDAGDSSSSTLFGGFTGQWVGEAGEITAQVPKLLTIKLQASTLALLCEVSNQLAADGRGYTDELQTALITALSWHLDDAFLIGSGAGMPRGVLHDAALIVVAKEVGQGGATIEYSNLTKMVSRLHPACVNNAIWVAHTSTRQQLLELSQPVGTGGSAVPVLTGSPGNYQVLLMPVVFTEKTPALGAEGDLLLVDLSQYTIGLRQGLSIDQSMHVGFTRNTSHWRGLLRADGRGRWSAPYEPKNGDTLSWCVTLAERT